MRRGWFVHLRCAPFCVLVSGTSLKRPISRETALSVRRTCFRGFLPMYDYGVMRRSRLLPKYIYTVCTHMPVENLASCSFVCFIGALKRVRVDDEGDSDFDKLVTRFKQSFHRQIVRSAAMTTCKQQPRVQQSCWVGWNITTLTTHCQNMCIICGLRFVTHPAARLPTHLVTRACHALVQSRCLKY
jgi:hypothetical protein